jgi:nucleoside-diphosphate-sugar epimerase
MSTPLPGAPPQILIVGCGYTGLRAARFWLQAGYSVAAITRSTARAAELQQQGLQTIVTDLAADSPVPQLPDCPIIVWSAGYDRSSGCTRRQLWIHGLEKLLRSLPDRGQPRRVLLTSTTGVYGDASGSTVDESTPPQPVQEGGIVCLEAEQLLQSWCQQHNHTAVILRLAGIYGPHRLLRRLQDLRDQRPIPASPDEWLNLIHVDDIVTALDHCAFSSNPPAVMNLAAAETATRRTYYQTLAELAGTPAPVFQPTAESSTRGSSGNRRVSSLVRPVRRLTFQYENCRSGLIQALAADAELH